MSLTKNFFFSFGGDKPVGEKVSFKEKVGFALGDAGFNMFWMPWIFYGLYYCTDVVGISAVAAGLVFFVTRLWDVVNDPMMGFLSDRVKPIDNIGKYRPIIAWFAIPFGLMAALSFWIPEISETGKVVYFAVVYTLFGMLYTVTNIPYSSVMSTISKDLGERNQVSYFRMIAAQVSIFLFASNLKIFVNYFGNGNERMGFGIVMTLAAVVAIGLILISVRVSRERVYSPAKPSGEAKKDLKNMITNIPWWVLFFVSFFTIAAFTIRFSAAPYYFKYFADEAAKNAWGGEGLVMSYFWMSNTISSILGLIIFSIFCKKIDKKKLYIVLITISGLVSVYFYFVPSTEIFMMLGTQCLFSFITAPTGAIMFAMYTDIGAYVRYKTGSACDGLVMSAGSLSQKFGWTVGGSLAGILLGLAGYQANVTQPEAALEIMKKMMSWYGMVPCLLGAISMLFYSLNDKKVKEIQAQLDAR
ncbi:MAG: MFS transporter [Oligoflexia bacterium]|nr:MFS transporter [Oligoflexia bacterium]